MGTAEIATPVVPPPGREEAGGRLRDGGMRFVAGPCAKPTKKAALVLTVLPPVPSNILRTRVSFHAFVLIAFPNCFFIL